MFDSLEYTITSLQELSGEVLRVFAYPAIKKINYAAGQYVEILYPDNSYQPFSIANAPCSDYLLELHIRHLPEDPLTAKFISQIKKQKKLIIRGPFGHCAYQLLNKPILLLAGGTGFAQAKALVEQIARTNNIPNTAVPAETLRDEGYQGENRDSPPDCKQKLSVFAPHINKEAIAAASAGIAVPNMHLYWGVKAEKDFYLAELPKQWTKEIINFRYTPIISQKNSTHWQGQVGYTTQAAIKDYPDLTNFVAYVSGPMPMATSAFALLTQQGLPKKYYYSDMLSQEN